MSLSEPAFHALREEKQEGESDSDVVLRLVTAVRAARRDPLRFPKVARRRERALSPEEHREAVRRMDERDREKAKRRWGKRRAGA